MNFWEVLFLFFIAINVYDIISYHNNKRISHLHEKIDDLQKDITILLQYSNFKN